MNLTNIKRSTKYGLGIAIYSFIMICLFYKYDKGADHCVWWDVHIYWWSVVASVVTVTAMVFWKSYQDMVGRASLRLFILPIIGGLICFAMGAIWQEKNIEPTPSNGIAQIEAPQGNTNITNNHYYYDSPRESSGNSGIGEILGGMSDSGDSGEGGGEALVFLVLLIVIVILAIGSAFIPHFWVMAMVINLTIMLVFFIREHDFEQGAAFSLFYKGK